MKNKSKEVGCPNITANQIDEMIGNLDIILSFRYLSKIQFDAISKTPIYNHLKQMAPVLSEEYHFSFTLKSGSEHLKIRVNNKDLGQKLSAGLNCSFINTQTERDNYLEISLVKTLSIPSYLNKEKQYGLNVHKRDEGTYYWIANKFIFIVTNSSYYLEGNDQKLLLRLGKKIIRRLLDRTFEGEIPYR